MTADPDCKAGKTIETYGLASADPMYDSLDRGLLARWTGADGRSAMGYRSLTDWFNKRLLKSVYDEHGRETLGARIENDYEVLQGDDDIVARELSESLRTDGIDSAQLRASLVSWGTMRTHLTECLDGEKESEPASTDWEAESIRKAIAVTERKASTAVSALSTKGRLDGGDTAEITVQIQLGCGSCPTRVPFEVALRRGYVCDEHASPRVSRDST